MCRPLRIIIDELITKKIEHISFPVCTKTLLDFSFDLINRQLSHRHRLPLLLPGHLPRPKRLSNRPIHTLHHLQLASHHIPRPPLIETRLHKISKRWSRSAILLSPNHYKINIISHTIRKSSIIKISKLKFVHLLLNKFIWNMKRNYGRKKSNRKRGKDKGVQGFDEKEMHFYDLVTGKYKYVYTPWAEEDL